MLALLSNEASADGEEANPSVQNILSILDTRMVSLSCGIVRAF